jgi:hypothetical protein
METNVNIGRVVKQLEKRADPWLGFEKGRAFPELAE